MQHTTRMILIPEDLYKELKQRVSNQLSLPDNTLIQNVSDDKRLMETAQNMSILSHDNKGMSGDERQILYLQQQKIHQKLLQDRDSKPFPVEVKNFPSIDENLKTSKTFSNKNLSTPKAKDLSYEESTLNETPNSSNTSYESLEGPSDRIVNYLMERRELFGIAEDGKIINETGNGTIKGGKIEKIVEYLLNSKDGREPAGYKRLAKLLEKDKNLQNMLERYQNGGSLVNKRKLINDVRMIKFKPKLWG